MFGHFNLNTKYNKTLIFFSLDPKRALEQNLTSNVSFLIFDFWNVLL